MFLTHFKALNWQIDIPVMGNTLAWLISSVFSKITTQPLGKLTNPLKNT
jgi:hypothetical protein